MGTLEPYSLRTLFMLNRLKSVFSSPQPQPKQLNIISHGQESCGVPFEKIKDVMEWLGLSLLSAGYKDTAHIVWDHSDSDVNITNTSRQAMRKGEPLFLYRCGDRPSQTPANHYWRLMSEYPTLRVYQLERKDD
ncbi:MAG: hypothetical protein AAGB19_01660 [Cyanobacteria bacterium P01_F01_bin.3]